MTTEQIINKSLKEIAMAQEMMNQATQLSYRARRRLESVYPPASSKRAKKGLSDAQVASVIGKRNKKLTA